MKRIFAFALSALLVSLLLPVGAAADGGTVTINVYNWGQYISDGTTVIST
jgi:spermidine/putrescine-binding protein